MLVRRRRGEEGVLLWKHAGVKRGVINRSIYTNCKRESMWTARERTAGEEGPAAREAQRKKTRTYAHSQLARTGPGRWKKSEQRLLHRSEHGIRSLEKKELKFWRRSEPSHVSSPRPLQSCSTSRTPHSVCTPASPTARRPCQPLPHLLNYSGMWCARIWRG